MKSDLMLFVMIFVILFWLCTCSCRYHYFLSCADFISFTVNVAIMQNIDSYLLVKQSKRRKWTKQIS